MGQFRSIELWTAPLRRRLCVSQAHVVQYFSLFFRHNIKKNDTSDLTQDKSVKAQEVSRVCMCKS